MKKNGIRGLGGFHPVSSQYAGQFEPLLNLTPKSSIRKRKKTPPPFVLNFYKNKSRGRDSTAICAIVIICETDTFLLNEK